MEKRKVPKNKKEREREQEIWNGSEIGNDKLLKLRNDNKNLESTNDLKNTIKIKIK